MAIGGKAMVREEWPDEAGQHGGLGQAPERPAGPWGGARGTAAPQETAAPRVVCSGPAEPAWRPPGISRKGAEMIGSALPQASRRAVFGRKSGTSHGSSQIVVAKLQINCVRD
ncbi:hypothetical protein GCM10011316_08920 [Roseibium aquae]|uniref:Uncharacterized protein n=1 Tax=Roseibium aquae TaxID=1323746 RepID=A0A916TCE2_9HYPH|nr:hypothetical protein GCM10011316_08920 [Roseibium aquae]